MHPRHSEILGLGALSPVSHNQTYRGSCPTPSTTGMWEPPKSVWLKEKWDVSILHFAFARAVTRAGEEPSRATYRHTPPASTGKSPSAIQRSLALPARRWGTLGSAPGCRPHRWHCTGSRAATGSTFLQIHKPTAMRNVSASLPLKAQPFVFFLRKTAVNNQTMQTARPKKQVASRDEPKLPLVFFFSPHCHLQHSGQFQVLPGTTAKGNESTDLWSGLVIYIFIQFLPDKQHLQQDNLIDGSTVTADLDYCDRMISLQCLMKWQHWLTLYLLLSIQVCYWIIHLTACRSLLFYCLWLDN